MATVSPLDVEAIAAAAATGAIVTAEEGLARGGLGGAIAEYCAEHAPVRMRMLGFPGFLPTGSASWLMEHFGLTAAGIAAAARDLLGKGAN
jgi:transketolase